MLGKIENYKKLPPTEKLYNNYSKKLSIIILTYNRPQIFEEGINELITYCRPYLIKIYISDDSGTDWFEQKVKELKKKYEYIYVKKNNPPLKHDKNIIKALQTPNTEYVWLLGDAIRLETYSIRSILNIIDSHKPEFIAVNAKDRKLDYPSKLISNNNQIISNLGWHLTLTGATIYSRKVINFIDRINFKKIRNFPQFYLIFNFLGNFKSNLVWVNDKIIKVDVNKNLSYWASGVFEVFLDDWNNTLNNLKPLYSDEIIKNVYKSHSIKSGLFGLKSMIILRSLESYNYQIYNKYKFQIAANSNLNLKALFILSITPQKLCVYSIKLYQITIVNLIKILRSLYSRF